MLVWLGLGLIWYLFFLSCTNLLKFIILNDARVNVWLSQLWSLVNAISKATKITVGSLSCILLVN